MKILFHPVLMYHPLFGPIRNRFLPKEVPFNAFVFANVRVFSLCLWKCQIPFEHFTIGNFTK